MADLTLEQAAEQCQKALQRLRAANKELGWGLARRHLGVLGSLLDNPNEFLQPEDIIHVPDTEAEREALGWHRVDTKSDPRD